MSKAKRFFTTNVGIVDQGIRALLGLALVFLAAIGLIGPWGYIGIVAILTGAFRFCPLYRVFGFTTCAARAAAGKH
jgi:hypothetical protein